MSVSDLTGTRSRTTADDRAACQALRAEKAHVVRWRRLLRARLDLAVAGYLPPADLGSGTWHLAPAAHLELPLPRDLCGAVTVPAATDGAALMERLRLLDRRLATYSREIDAALESFTEKVVDDLLSVPHTPVASVDAR